MSTEKTPPAPTPAPFTASRQTLGNLLLVAAGVFAILVVVLLILKFGKDYWPVYAWASLLAATLAGCSLYCLATQPTANLSESDITKLVCLSAGALAGLWTAALGLTLPFSLYSETFAGGYEKWKKSPREVLIALTALFGGLALMFVSLQLGRGTERTSPIMRRLMYGYNAVLTGLLLLGILVFVNLLPYLPLGSFDVFNIRSDWTASGLFTLEKGSINTLRALDKPVQVYALLRGRTLEAQSTTTLLENCRSVTRNLSWQLVTPQGSPDEFRKLITKYQIPSASPFGILVTMGEEPNVQYEFIEESKLYSESRGAGDQSFTYKGEQPLINTIAYLREGKVKATVYFTHGAGEGNLNDMDRTSPRGLGILKERLTASNYTVKDLKLGLKADAVPDDADLVVVVAPQVPFSPEAADALRKYLKPTDPAKKPGRLMLLSGVVVHDGVMTATGLESLLADYNVRLGDGRIMMFKTKPTEVIAYVNLQSSNPICQAFITPSGQTLTFDFQDARTVTPLNPNAPNPSIRVDTLVQTGGVRDVWEEMNLRADPDQLLKEYLKPENRKELAKRAVEELPVAVTVTEGNIPRVPGHEALSGQETPRMIVFGASNWVMNAGLNNQKQHADLFLSCAAWLRGKSDIGPAAGEKGKRRERFTLSDTIKPETQEASRLRWLPALFIFLGIIGVGGGVWITRRR
jgi:hypothetical protein